MRLANAEGLAASANEALALLDESTPDAPSITDLIGKLLLSFQELARLDSSRNNLVELADSQLPQT